MGKSTELYLRIWRTANERGSLTLKYGTSAECVSMRLKLYRAVQPFRGDGSEFAALIDEMEIVTGAQDGYHTLTIRRQDNDPLILEARRQLDALEKPE